MIYIALVLAFLGVFLSILRLIKGKEIENRVVAIDIITTIVTGILLIFSYLSNNSLMLDVALVYAILSFIFVIVITRYLEGGI